MAKLKIEDIKYIWNHYKRIGNRSNLSSLAVKFNVNAETIRRIVIGKRWNNI